MAGLRRSVETGIAKPGEIGVLDSTAHMLKFLSFQDMYFQDRFDPAFGVKPRKELKNAPLLVKPETLTKFPSPGSPLQGEDMERFVEQTVAEIARILGLEKR